MLGSVSTTNTMYSIKFVYKSFCVCATRSWTKDSCARQALLSHDELWRTRLLVQGCLEVWCKDKSDVNSISLSRDKIGKVWSGGGTLKELRLCFVDYKRLELSVPKPLCAQSAMQLRHPLSPLCNIAWIASHCMMAFYWLCPIAPLQTV